MVAIFSKTLFYGDVVYAQTWQVLALKNCIEPPYQQGTCTNRAVVASLYIYIGYKINIIMVIPIG